MSFPLLISGNAPSMREARAATPLVSAQDIRGGLDLDGEWRFRPGDDPAWASVDYDDSGWQGMPVPKRWPRGGYPETGQMAWYRLTLQLTPEVVAEGKLSQLALCMGKVLSSYELYAGGRLVGGVGHLPPLSRPVYDRQAMYIVPESAVGADGRLVIALRVWGGEEASVRVWSGGPSSGTFKIGDYRRLLLSGVIQQVPGLLFCALTLAFGAHHLLFYLRNRSLRVHLWFGLLALDIALYGLMLTQWKYLFHLPFLVLKKIEYGAIYLLPAVSIQMLGTLLCMRIPRPLRYYQLSFVAFALLAVVVPGEAIHYYTLQLWQMWSLPLIGYTPWLLLREARRGNLEARTVLPAVLLFLGTCVNDMLIDVLYLDSVRLMPLGFIAILIAMSVSMVNRFTNMYSKLESEVAQRTAELSKANRLLEKAASVDPLTGLLNRRGFTTEAEAEVARMTRTGAGFSIVLGDVDFFKRFNDQFGHICGDHVLRRVADILFRRTRDIDQIGRWGGEEFILLLPETENEGAVVLAEKLREAVAESVFEFGGQRMGITMTFGVAAFQMGDTLDGCITRADTALYHGKKDGRNRVMISRCRGLSLVN